jgi:hypothetical protein
MVLTFSRREPRLSILTSAIRNFSMRRLGASRKRSVASYRNAQGGRRKLRSAIPLLDRNNGERRGHVGSGADVQRSNYDASYHKNSSVSTIASGFVEPPAIIQWVPRERYNSVVVRLISRRERCTMQVKLPKTPINQGDP